MPNIGNATFCCNGQQYLGYQSLRITRGLERFPSDFEMTLTEANDKPPPFMLVGSSCDFIFGKNQKKMLTGTIERNSKIIVGNPPEHKVTVTGRSTCRNIFDCAAVITLNKSRGKKGMDLTNGSLNQLGQSTGGGTNILTNFTNASVFDLITRICDTYGVIVNIDKRLEDKIIPFINVSPLDTAYSVIDRLCRFCGFLFYDNEQAQAVLTSLGAYVHSSGIDERVNVLQLETNNDISGRYSDIYTVRNPLNSTYQDSLSGSPYSMVSQHAHATDPNTDIGNEYRPLLITDEQPSAGNSDLNFIRAQWQMNRLIARGTAVKMIVDSWTDSKQNLWAPNALLNVNCPSIGINNVQLLISSVTYICDLSAGSTAELLLMNPKAFVPEPIAILPPSPLLGLDQSLHTP